MAKRPDHLPLTSPYGEQDHMAPQDAPEKKSVPSGRASATNSSKAAPVATAKSKAALWADEDVVERIRAAWFHTPTTSQDRELSFSEFLLQAALTRAKARERKFNDGKEFPRVPAGKIGPGRKS